MWFCIQVKTIAMRGMGNHTEVLLVRQWKKSNVCRGTTILFLSKSLKGMRALEPTITAGKNSVLVNLTMYCGITLYLKPLIKSNHFYCHITTAQVPWWVKFLRACSRQCKTIFFTYRQCLYLQTVQKTMCKKTYIYSVHTVYYKTYLVTNTHYTPYVHILHYVHIYT